MPFPLVAAAVAGLRVAAPFVIRGAGGLLSRRLTVGGTAAMMAAPTALSAIDNLTGNELSERLMDLPFGDAIAAVLGVGEWANEQQASVVSNAILHQLKERDVISEDDADYETSERIANVIGHVIVGDSIGAATAAAELGVQPSDIAAAIQRARDENPGASFGEIGAIAFADVKQQVIEARREQEAPDEQPVQQPALTERFNIQARYQEQLTRVRSLSGSDLQQEFNRVKDEDGLNMSSSTNMFMATALDFLGLDGFADQFRRAVVVEDIMDDMAEELARFDGVSVPAPVQGVLAPAI